MRESIFDLIGLILLIYGNISSSPRIYIYMDFD